MLLYGTWTLNSCKKTEHRALMKNIKCNNQVLLISQRPNMVEKHTNHWLNTWTKTEKWLPHFFALPFIHLDKIEDRFVEDLYSVAPQDARCHLQKINYVKNIYILDTCFQSVSYGQKNLWSSKSKWYIQKYFQKSFGPNIKHCHVIIRVSQIHDFYLIFNIHFSYMTCGKVLQFHTDWSLYKYKYR